MSLDDLHTRRIRAELAREMARAEVRANMEQLRRARRNTRRMIVSVYAVFALLCIAAIYHGWLA